MSRAVLVVAVAVAAAGCGGTRTVTRTVTVAAPPGQEVREFGYVKALARKGGRWELRFDPAWLLSGLTARRAKLEDTGSSDVPNDVYRVDEGHRQLTYLVASDARVTVLVHGANGTRITVAQLARLVAGERVVKLYEPLTTGFWIRVDVDTVRSLDQQYFP